MQSVDGVNGFKSVLSGVQTMVNQHGPRSLWRGLVPTMWRDVPFSGKIILWLLMIHVQKVVFVLTRLL